MKVADASPAASSRDMLVSPKRSVDGSMLQRKPETISWGFFLLMSSIKGLAAIPVIEQILWHTLLKLRSIFNLSKNYTNIYFSESVYLLDFLLTKRLGDDLRFNTFTGPIDPHYLLTAFSSCSNNSSEG